MDPWICPRCHTVHAAWVAQCTCNRTYTTASSTVSFRSSSPYRAAFELTLAHIERMHEYDKRIAVAFDECNIGEAEYFHRVRELSFRVDATRIREACDRLGIEAPECLQ